MPPPAAAAIGILDRRIDTTPIAVIDFETTGLTPGVDRAIEMSVVRVEPGGDPALVLDTLINPRRPVAATEIHGITDGDVADAPTFSEIAPRVQEALADCIIAAYNVYFDMRFLDFEFSNACIFERPPHFCLMYMRPMLGLGKRCSLSSACQEHNIEFRDAHITAQDTLASAALLQQYLDHMRSRRVHTFRDLTTLRKYKFCESFRYSPIMAPNLDVTRSAAALKSRGSAPAIASTLCSASQRTRNEPGDGAVVEVKAAPASRVALGEYWEELKIVIQDLEITPDEWSRIRHLQESLDLDLEHIRMLHARAFAGVIGRFIGDEVLDDRERTTLRRLHRCLSQLGWAPGE